MKPLIGITTGEVINLKFAWAPYVYGQSYTYAEAIKAAGGIPVLLPFLDSSDDARQLVGRLDGVLFAGGNDVVPELYGRPVTHASETSRRRDDWELLLIEAAQSADLPVLSICRGLQLLNVSRGGTLHQDLRLDGITAFNHNSSEEFSDPAHLAHPIDLKTGTKLHGILGVDTIQTNSQHHQSIDTLGKGLIVNARADDGIIEGVEDPDKDFVVAVQSHPEGLFDAAQTKWSKFFSAFIDAARK